MKDEQRQRASTFVEEYIALCNKYAAEVVINTHGVHCVALDSGECYAFATVCPVWLK